MSPACLGSRCWQGPPRALPPGLQIALAVPGLSGTRSSGNVLLAKDAAALTHFLCPEQVARVGEMVVVVAAVPEASGDPARTDAGGRSGGPARGKAALPPGHPWAPRRLAVWLSLSRASEALGPGG